MTTTAQEYNRDGDKTAQPAPLAFWDPVSEKTYMFEIDPADPAIPVSGNIVLTPSPILISRNGADTEVALDTATPANNRPLPSVILAGDSLGPVAVDAGATGATTLRMVIASDQASLFATQSTLANVDSTLTAVSGLVNTIANNTPTLVGGRVPVDVGVSVLPTGAATETTLAAIRTRTDIVNHGATTAAMRVAADVGQAGVAVGIANPLYVTIPGLVSTTLDFINGVSVQAGFGTPGTGALRTAAMLGVGTTAVSTSNPVPTDARQVNGNIVEVAYGTGASSGAQRVVAMMGVGTAAVSSSNPVNTDLRTVVGTTIDIGHGASGAGTQRVAAMLGVGSAAASASNPVPVSQGVGSAAVQLVSSSQRPYFQDFSSPNLTTAYTEVIASLGTAVNRFCATNNSSTAILIATGAAASEVVQYILMPGENAMNVPLAIAAGVRVSIRTQTGTLSSGQFSLNVFA